jgi:large subunit ribosomal protein L35
MSKTRKSIAKRFKITKNKKLLHRTCGQNHFNSNESGKKTRKKRRNKPMSKSFTKTIKQHLR